jgi:basic membrane protein A
VPALPRAGARRICLLADNNRGANALTDLLYDGVQKATVDYGWESASLVPVTATDAQTMIDRFLQSDCDLIYTAFHGYDATLVAAPGHPNQKFLMEDRVYDPPLENVWAQTYATDQPAFLAGYLAAALSKSGKVGTFGGINYDPGVTDYMDGLALGVAYYDQRNGANVQVLGWDVAKHEGLFVGDFCCRAQGYEFANQLMDLGADIILPVAGPDVGAGAASAIRANAGRVMIGVDYDWAVTDPADAPVVLTSIEKRFDVTLLHAVRDISDGSFTGGTHIGTLANGEVGLAPFHKFDAAVSPQLKADLAQIQSDIIAGKIATKPTLAKPSATPSPMPAATTPAPP